ncbi:hypothetical protein EON64_10275 [archaeon]|nr:MAG: hypothetical protein EON64_10275 [archaeon]
MKAGEGLVAHLDKMQVALEEAVRDPGEPDGTADFIYCFSLVVKGVLSEIAMWIAIREGNNKDAWNHLIDAQSAVRVVLDHCPMITKAENRLRMLEDIERVVFPPQVFQSPGLLCKRKCSICEADPIDCDHIRGRLYRGKRCVHIFIECKPYEFSIVDVPEDKRRRIYRYVNDEGIWIDKLTNGPVDGHEELKPGKPGTMSGRVV